MFDQLLDPSPPEIGPSARAAVRGRVRTIVRRRRAVRTGGVAGVLMVGGAAALLATGGSDGSRRVTAADRSGTTTEETSTSGVTTTDETIPTAASTTASPPPEVPEPTTTGPGTPAETPNEPPVTVPAASVSGHIDCYDGQVAKYQLTLTGNGVTHKVPVAANGNYSAAQLEPGIYTAIVSCESSPTATDDSGTDIGGATTATRSTRTLGAGANVWNFTL